MTILVTGGAGFIGANFVIDWLTHSEERVVNLDKLTYAGNLNSLEPLRQSDKHVFVRGDIGDRGLMKTLLNQHRPRAIVHLAAESHVDRSIMDPEAFIETNIVGTYRLLDTALEYWRGLPQDQQLPFRFLHVSTDEVYGSLTQDAPPFSETTAYAPNSPYSASKAASDHLVRAYFHTYGLPVIATNCSNNYGPLQFPEKLIPLMILNALSGKPLPVYGDGLNVRDWLYVSDHCSALREVLARGTVGETYNVGGWNEKTNMEVVETLCCLLDEMHPASSRLPHKTLVTHVRDRPGHDRRYAIDAHKLKSQLGWTPVESFESGIRKTVRWYLDNPAWIQNVTSGEYRQWLSTNYVDREHAQ